MTTCLDACRHPGGKQECGAWTHSRELTSKQWRLQDRFEQVVLNLYIKPTQPIVSCITPLTGCALAQASGKIVNLQSLSRRRRCAQLLLCRWGQRHKPQAIPIGTSHFHASRPQ